MVSVAGVSNLSCILKHRRRDLSEIAACFYVIDAAVKGLITWPIFVDSAATLDCTRSVVLSLKPFERASKAGVAIYTCSCVACKHFCLQWTFRTFCFGHYQQTSYSRGNDGAHMKSGRLATSNITTICSMFQDLPTDSVTVLVFLPI